jgi:glycosyltransferase involved in cell wall biosynthesis
MADLTAAAPGVIPQPMPPLISVVIPCYRQAHFLAQALDSVQAQSYPAHELIVIDDGSPDDVRAVTDRYPGVRCYRQENRGLGAARNSGLERVEGDFVVFLDADDRLLPTALAVGAESLAARPHCAFVWGFNRPIDVHGNLLPFEPRSFSGGASYAQLLRENVVGPPVGVSFRRAVVAAAGGFSCEHKVEDYELYLRLARNHQSWCHGELIAEYRLHDANMSSDHVRMLSGMLAALDAQEEWVGNNPELRRALAQGRRNALRQYDAEPRIERLRVLLRGRRWVEASAAGAILLLKYPGMVLRAVARRARRSFLPSSA